MNNNVVSQSEKLINNHRQVLSGKSNMKVKRVYSIMVSTFKKVTYECLTPTCPGKQPEGEYAEFKSDINILPQQCPYCGGKIIKLKSIEFDSDKMQRVKKR